MKYKNIAPAKPYVEKKLKDKTIQLLYNEERVRTEIARLVRLARERAGLSQRELAEKAETTQAVIGRIELGTDSRMPSIMLLTRILQATNAHLELKCIFGRSA